MRAFGTCLILLACQQRALGQFSRVISSGYGGYGGISSPYSYGYSSPVYGSSYGSSYGGSYGYAPSYSVAAAPAVSYATAPVATAVRAVHVAAAPAVATSYHTVAAPAVAHVAAAPALATSYHTVAAPAVHHAVHHVAAPAVHHVAAAPIGVQYSSVAAQPIHGSVIAAAPATGPSVHEVHTGSSQKTIRIEEVQGGDQVIRVHEQPSGAPQIDRIEVPGEQSHIRVVNRNVPARVERVVHRAQTNVVDVNKPGRPGARIVQVVKGQNPAPTVEFINEGGSSHNVYYADDAQSSYGGAGLAVSGGGLAISAAPAASYAVHAAPAASYAVAAPASYAIAAPAASYGSYATRVHAVHAAPIQTASYSRVHTVAAPVTSYATRIHAAPASSYYSPALSYGGFNYGGLGYSTGYTRGSLGGSNVYLDYKKSAKAAA